MKAWYTAALPQLDYFPRLPYIIQNPPFCVISCQIFAEQSSQGGSNPLPQNIRFVIQLTMPFLGIQLYFYISVGHLTCSHLFPFCPWRLKCVLIFLKFFLFVSQRHFQTVVSLSVLPDSLVTERQWVYSSSPTMTRPLAPKPLWEIQYKPYCQTVCHWVTKKLCREATK